MRAPSTFWRDPALPFIEVRSVTDGRKVNHALHTHETFSVGAVIGGHSTYINGKQRQPISAGAVVVVNPQQVHACNPVADQPWAYHMLYVDTHWLGDLQRELGASHGEGFSGFATTLTVRSDLHAGLNALVGVLHDPHAATLGKHEAVIQYFSALQSALTLAPPALAEADSRLARAAELIADQCTQALTLDEICAAAGLSASHLIRAFKQRYGMTPHAYLVNCRVQYSRQQLRQGRPIAAVAAEAGFADQAHLQRAFKQLLAATPGHYRG